ncbi:hypothetical protein [Gemmata sp.]|uniref:hypothetical protein n=1 Tax=Gemmata sp. TaxID=1914242 RepID=UPI003F6F5E8D
MTREEVTRAVGGPPGDYVPDALKGYVLVNPRGVGYEGYDRWVTDEVELLVLFGPDGRAHDIRIWDVSVR